MNHYFQFKQFTIHQDKCAMKVTEVACILGAWTVIPKTARKVLDIGCGTGLLSLMLAQRFSEVQIDAIELDTDCWAQAKENVDASVFNHRIHCIQGDVLQHNPDYHYDFVIVNPPFFENDLKSKDAKKNIAWHSDALPMDALIGTINVLLHPKGSFSILLPSSRMDALMKLTSNYHFFLHQILEIQHSPRHESLYKVCIFSKEDSTLHTEKLIIRENQVYTPNFVNLLQDFYLKL